MQSRFGRLGNRRHVFPGALAEKIHQRSRGELVCPGLTHRVDWVFTRAGMPLKITAEYENWRRVEDFEGAGGWVHYSLLSGVRTVMVTLPPVWLNVPVPLPQLLVNLPRTRQAQ